MVKSVHSAFLTEGNFTCLLAVVLILLALMEVVMVLSMSMYLRRRKAKGSKQHIGPSIWNLRAVRAQICAINVSVFVHNQFWKEH